MRFAHWTTIVVGVAVCATRAHAQVSCADPDNLCTGDPCTIVTTQVQSPCVVDFGNRTLEIAGVLDVPDAGTLSFTAATIRLLGRLDGRHVGNGVGTGAEVELIATTGDVELRGEVDVTGTVAAGTIHVDAAGNVLVKDRLNAKSAGTNVTATGGSILLEADGSLTTDQTAVVDAQGLDTLAGGSVGLRGATGAIINGRVRVEGNPSGTIEVSSSTGMVKLQKDLRAESTVGLAGAVLVSGQTGVVVAQKIDASAPRSIAGLVTITSPGGDVSIEDDINARGVFGGIVDISAPLGTVSPLVTLNVRGMALGGSLSISAANLDLHRNLGAESRSGNAGVVTISATGLLHLNGADVKVKGKQNGGTVNLFGGDITVERTSAIDARGALGDGGTLVAAAPTGTVSIFTSRAALTGRNAGGHVIMDAAALAVGPTRIDADGHVAGAEMRFNQSGAGTMLLSGTFEARRGGTIEGLAPAGNLAASGRFRVAPGGCIGLSAGGTLMTTAIFDVPLTPTCP